MPPERPKLAGDDSGQTENKNTRSGEDESAKKPIGDIERKVHPVRLFGGNRTHCERNQCIMYAIVFQEHQAVVIEKRGGNAAT